MSPALHLNLVVHRGF